MTTDRQVCELDEATLVTRVDLVVPGALAAVTPAVERIMDVVREMACSAGKEFEIELALAEAIGNAVEHGCAGDPTKSVQVCVGCDPERGLLVVVRDPGPGFDPSQVPSPVAGERIFESGGRGIFLINQLMDEVRFERGGTEIRFRKR
ncbi:MAG: ATP-binding protein [Thermoanaerobaculaceae bacterium]